MVRASAIWTFDGCHAQSITRVHRVENISCAECASVGVVETMTARAELEARTVIYWPNSGGPSKEAGVGREFF